jgi:hypothetical protein
MVTGHHRGHPIYWDEERQTWLYVDDHSPASVDRPCVACHLMPTPEGHDPCLGHIPSVTSACCGHGVHEGFAVFPQRGIVALDPIHGPRAITFVAKIKEDRATKPGQLVYLVAAPDLHQLMRLALEIMKELGETRDPAMTSTGVAGLVLSLACNIKIWFMTFMMNPRKISRRSCDGYWSWDHHSCPERLAKALLGTLTVRRGWAVVTTSKGGAPGA